MSSSASKRKQVVFSKTCSLGFLQLRETTLVSPEQPHHDQQDASSEKKPVLSTSQQYRIVQNDDT